MSRARLTVLALVPMISGGAVGCGDKELPPLFQREPAQVIPNPDVPHERLPAASSAFEETACLSLVQDRVTQCGFVTVPEGPGSNRTIKLAVARVFSESATVSQDPVVYLTGGPGGDSINDLGEAYGDYATFAPLAPERDFIFIDQRGVGASVPALYCGSSADESLLNCFDELSESADLAEYNTRNSASDIDQIRRAFGYGSWNLLGISYGTRLALTVMRDYPEGLRAVILDSVVPLQADFLAEKGARGYGAMQLALAACQQDEDCDAAFPELEAKLIEIVESLNETPFEGDGYEVTGDLVLSVVFNLLYSPVGIGYVPQMITTLARRDFGIFEDLEEATRRGTALGMHLSLQCSEEVPFSGVDSYEFADEAVPAALRSGFTADFYLEYCEEWPVPKAPTSENEPVKSDVPTLVMAGEFDPITPPAYAELVAGDLSNSTLITVNGESHGASVGPCGTSLAKAFIRDPNLELNTDCLSSTPQLAWYFEPTDEDPAGEKSGMSMRTSSEERLLDKIRRETRRRR